MGVLKEWNQEWKAGSVDKSTHAARMYSEYVKLLDYCDLLSGSWVKEIRLNVDHVMIDIERRTDTHTVNLSMPLYASDGGMAAILLTRGSFEPNELAIVDRLLTFFEKNACALDIGANYGWYSMNISKQRPDMTIYAFEPIPQTFQRMVMNLKLNNLPHVVPFNFGLSSEEKMVDFYFDTVASGASSMRNLREVETTVIQSCKVRCLNHIVQELGLERLDFIKCDVEGSELFVYRGGLECLKEFKPVVFSEMLRKWSAKFGYHPNDIIKLFREIGYECFVIGANNTLRPFDWVDEETIETNYFFLHQSKHADLIKSMLMP